MTDEEQPQAPTDDEREIAETIKLAQQALGDAYPGSDLRDHYERLDRIAAGFRHSEVPEPSVEEFREQIADERARQIDDGYDILHDRMHGVDHLLLWAQDYARRGRMVQTAALIEAARELIAKSPEPQGEPSDAQADAAQKAFHEYTFGPDDDFLTPRRLGITRQAWKTALHAAGVCGERVPNDDIWRHDPTHD